jgi:Ca-activated chloride channel homolog
VKYHGPRSSGPLEPPAWNFLETGVRQPETTTAFNPCDWSPKLKDLNLIFKVTGRTNHIMKSWCLCFCLLFLTGIFFPSNAGAQTPERNSGKPAENIIVNVDLVNVIFTVSDRRGRLVTNLDKTDFRILENGIPQNITNFSRETDIPLSIGLLIDTSTSVRDRFKFEQEAAMDFLIKALRPGKDRAMIISFDTGIDLVQDFTDDLTKLSQGIHEIRPGGGTKMLDAIYQACEEKLRPETGRKVIIVISDGDDNLSLRTLAATMEIAQKADVTIFCISTNSSGFMGVKAPQADKVMRKLAEETGGKAFFPFKAEDLSQSFLDIGIELRSQYSLAYRSSSASRDGSFRTIRLETSQKNLKIKSRRGYYAPRG